VATRGEFIADIVATDRVRREQSGDGRRDCCSVTDGAIRHPGDGLPLLVLRIRDSHAGGDFRSSLAERERGQRQPTLS